MIKFIAMDEQVTLQKQMDENVNSIVLINVFNIKPADIDQFMSAWIEESVWMKAQPGYISTQLHRGSGGSGVFINYAIWESVADFKKAFEAPDSQKILGHYPSDATISPYLFQKIAVPRICVA